MTKNTRVSVNSSTLTTASTFHAAVDSSAVPSAPQTKRTDVLQWESCFRPQDIPIPEGFEDIDALIESREGDPMQRLALEAARRRLGDKLAALGISLAAPRLRTHTG